MRRIVIGGFAFTAMIVAGSVTVWPTPQAGPAALKPPVAPPHHVVPIGSIDPVCREPSSELANTVGVDLVARTSPRRIGPYTVPVGGFVADPAASPSHDSYAPMLVSANAGQTLRFDLVDDLAPSSADPQADVTNLHTHGLIVSPQPPSVNGIPCPPGDYVFLSLKPDASQARARRSYVMHIPDDLPTSLFGLDRPGASNRMAHPSGLFWFHAHLHGESQFQVTEGLSGLISIGDPKTHLHVDKLDAHGNVVEDAALTKKLRDRTDVQYLALRDIQVNAPALPDKAASGTAATDTGAANYNPGLCSAPASGAPPVVAPVDSAWCGTRNPDGSGQAWLFTVNGQLFPRVTLAPNRDQLWRIANISSTVTYAIDLVDAAAADRGASEIELCAISIDGVVAGSDTSSTACAATNAHPGYKHIGVPLKKLLLMPASRVELYVRNIATVPTQPRNLVLRSVGFTTGQGGNGDPWPAVDLASVVMQGQRPDRAGLENVFSDLSPTTPTPAPAATPAARSAPAAVNPPALCTVLPPDTAGQAFRRQIIFDQSPTTAPPGLSLISAGDDNSFGLGSQVISGPLASETAYPGSLIQAQSYAMGPTGAGGPHGAGDLPPQVQHVCAVLGRGEVWELLNYTPELHNFHIHQDKFRLAVATDPGAPSDLAAEGPFRDPGNLLQGFASIATAGTGDVQAWHDTLPVPPAANGTPGRVLVYIPFMATEQLGSFVFHCHILEHEDSGMMASIEVLDSSMRRAALSNICITRG